MSKVGKKSILIPECVTIENAGRHISVKGPKGTLVVNLLPQFDADIVGREIKITPKKTIKGIFALWGTQRALLQNAILGVREIFQKKLLIEGIGFGAQVQGKTLQLKLGFINPVVLEIPEGIEVKVEKNVISMSGIDKAKVGQFAALIKKQKPPEPYKGKGIRYEGEAVRRKAGKKVTGTTT